MDRPGPANNTDNCNEEGRFEQEHYKVFLVHSPVHVRDQYCRFVYVEINSLNLGRHTGHRFSAMRSAAGGLSVHDRTCSHPTESNPEARLRLVGWVRREAIGDIRRVCEAVPRIDYHCCQCDDCQI